MPTRAAGSDTAFRLDATLDFMRLLWSIEHGLQKRSKRMRAKLGLTGPQRLVLRIVSRFPGISAGELATIVRLHPSTITGILQRLTGRRLMRQEPDPRDGRRRQLWTTPAAARYTRASQETVEWRVDRALRSVGRGNVRAARVVLTELARALSD